MGAPSRLVGADDPHRVELCAAAVSVAEGEPSPVDLVLAGQTAHLQRGLGEADETGRADRIGREHAAGGVPWDVAVQRGGTGLGELPALTLAAEAEVFQPHRLVPAERYGHPGAVELAARLGDARLPVDVGRAVLARPPVHGVP